VSERGTPQGHKLAEVEESDPCSLEEGEHAALAHERQQRSAENEPVEAGENASDERAETR
jgi:hypothetical protein